MRRRSGYAVFSNRLWRDEKAVRLRQESPAAFAAWVMAITYCSDQETDGHLDAMALDFVHVTPNLARILVEKNMFEECEDGYIVHGYLNWNSSREEIEAAREKERKRVREFRTKNVTRYENASNSVRTKDETDLYLIKNKERRIKNIEITPIAPSQGARRAGSYSPAFETFWQAYPVHQDKRKASQAFQAAMRKPGVTLTMLTAAARRYASEDQVKRGYGKYASTWLRGECWTNPPQHPRVQSMNSAEQRTYDAMALIQRAAARDAHDQEASAGRPAPSIEGASWDED